MEVESNTDDDYDLINIWLFYQHSSKDYSFTWSKVSLVMFTYLVDIYSIGGFIVGHALWTVNLLSIRATEDCMYIRNQL